MSIHALTMPKWGLSMKEGKVVAWLVDEGAEVGSGTELVEVETEKILSSVEAPASGILRRKVARVEDVVPVSGLLGVIANASVADSTIDLFISDFQARSLSGQAEAEVSSSVPEVTTVEGQPLRYLKRGEGKEAVVLVHGFGGDLNTWLFNHEELAQDRAVFALDLPGHGGSWKQVGNGTLREFAKVLAQFMDSVGLPEAHLVGHSMGGAVTLEFAFAYPGRAASLVLIASAGLGSEIDGEYITGFVRAGRRKEIQPQLEKLFANSKLAGRPIVEEVLRYKRLDGVETALQTIASQLCPAGKQELVFRDRLSQLSIPILVIWGSEDRILPVTQAEGLPTNVMVEILSGAGHMVQMEAATKVNRLIRSFWESV